VDVVAPLDRVSELAQRLVDRAFHGKAVVTL
jgi:hypothetical protein